MRLLLFPLIVLLMGGCATAPTPKVAPERAWSARQDRLVDVQHWRLTGRIAVTTGEDAGHGRLLWSQANDQYDIRISGPFGSGTVRLAGDRGEASLWVDDQAPLHSSDPESLLYRRTGWWIPVEALRYWMVGLPAPRLSSDWQLDPYGRLATLRQAGWEIRFMDYDRHAGLELPERVFISNGEAEVKVIVQRWQTPDELARAILTGGGHG